MVSTGTPSELIGRRYQLQGKLGAGGMGAVYVATDRLTGEIVALKRVATRRASLENASLRLALTREFQTLASLRHPNVIGVLDYGFDDLRLPYFTMTLLDDAVSLRDAGRNLPLMRKLDLIIQLLQALVYLHRRGVIHRDLKPDNVLVTTEGQVKVLDFGLAVVNARRSDGQYAGTLRYMAPEVLHGEPPEPASDLYSVGVMAYELLTGHHPFSGSTSQELLDNILTHQPDMTGIDILTSGELRQRSRQAQAQPAAADETLKRVVDVDGATDRTLTLAETMSQDDLPTAVIHRADFERGRAEPDPTPESENPFVRIIQKLMAKYPERRYQNARDVIDDLHVAMGDPDRPETADIRESFLQSARFVGRDHELERLTLALNEAILGTGSIWLVGGESGVGKSRLLDELRTMAMVQGLAVLRGQAVSEGGLPYQMWREPLRLMLLNLTISEADAGVLKQIVPDIDRLLDQPVADAPALDAADAQERLLAAISQVFQAYADANPGGVLVLLEDVQWAGKSLNALNALQPLMLHLPLLVVCSYRNDEAPDLPGQVTGGQVMTLRRLNPADIADLSESMLGAAGRNPRVVALLQRETEGNVFFMIEVARALAEEAGELDKIGALPLPERVFAGGIQTLLQRRLDKVPPEYRPLLQRAAIHGRQVDMAVMAALAGPVAVDDWLTACANAAVMDAQDGHWRFAHDHLREQVLATLPGEQRPALYRQVAEAVEAVHGDSSEQAAALAYLWSHTGHHDKTYRYSRMAAEAAARISVYVEAERFYNQALALLLNGNVDYAATDEIALRVELGEIAGALGQYDRAVEDLTAALHLANKLNHHRQHAEALIGLGWVTMRQGDISRARWQSEEAVELVRASGDARLLVEASHLNGLIDVIEGRYEEAEELLSACLPLARALPDRQHTANVLNTLGAAEERLGRHAYAARHLSEALGHANALGNRYLAATIGANLGRLSYAQKDYADARAHFYDALYQFRALGNIYGEASALYFLGFIALAEGDPGEALPLLHESIHTSRRIGAVSVTLVALCGIARLLMTTGELLRAAELLGLVLYRAADADVEREAVPLLNALGEEVPPEALDAALERGKTRTLDSVTADIHLLKRTLAG